MILHFQNKKIKIDKKLIIAILILLVIIILLMLSQKNKRITCTKKEVLDSAHFTEIYTGIFKKDKLTVLIVDFINEPTSDYQHMLDSIYNNYSKQLEQLKTKGGYNYTIEKENNLVKFKSTIDVKKIPDETKNKVGFNSEWKYTAFKKNLEENGFKCK